MALLIEQLLLFVDFQILAIPPASLSSHDSLASQSPIAPVRSGFRRSVPSSAVSDGSFSYVPGPETRDSIRRGFPPVPSHFWSEQDNLLEQGSLEERGFNELGLQAVGLEQQRLGGFRVQTGHQALIWAIVSTWSFGVQDLSAPASSGALSLSTQQLAGWRTLTPFATASLQTRKRRSTWRQQEKSCLYSFLRRNGNAFEWRRRRAGAATVRGLCSLHPRDCRRGRWFGFCSGFGGASEGVRASSGFAQPILHGGGHCFSNVGRARRDARSIYHQEAACFADREFWRRSTPQCSRGGGGCSFDGFHQRGIASPFPLRSFKPALGHGPLLPRFHQRDVPHSGLTGGCRLGMDFYTYRRRASPLLLSRRGGPRMPIEDEEEQDEEARPTPTPKPRADPSSTLGGRRQNPKEAAKDQSKMKRPTVASLAHPWKVWHNRFPL